MARKGKGYTGTKRSLSPAELEAAFEQELDILKALCEDFDNGRIEYAFLIATQIQKLLTEGQTAVRRRGAASFISPKSEDNPNILSPYYLLTGIELGGGLPPTGNFVPVYRSDRNEWEVLKFSKWWAEAVFRASAALPGTPPGLIPVNGTPSVPYEKRERLNRRQIIQILRDHRGSHSLEEFPEVLEEIDGPSSWGGFACVDEQTGQEYSTDDGTLHWNTGQLAATVRQIAWEVLVAFSRIPGPMSKSG